MQIIKLLNTVKMVDPTVLDECLNIHSIHFYGDYSLPIYEEVTTESIKSL